MNIAPTRGRLAWRLPTLSSRPLRVGIALLITFGLVAALVGTRRLADVDVMLMDLAKVVTTDELDLAVGVISYLAAAEVSLVAMLLLVYWLWRRGVAANRAGAPLLFLLTLPLEILLKFTLAQPVPGAGLYRKTIRYALMGLSTMQSFPSGHATRTAFMTVLAGYLLFRCFGRTRALMPVLALTGLALVSGWSRIYLGYHWPTDVVGGFLLGGGIAAIAIAVLSPARLRSD